MISTIETLSSKVLEARNLKSRCQQGRASSEGFGEEAFLPLPSFWLVPAILGVPWLVAASLHTSACTWPLSSAVSPLYVCVSPGIRTLLQLTLEQCGG